jgi:protein TonB
LLVIAILAGVGWWFWNSDWRELEHNAEPNTSSAAALPVELPSASIERRIVHRVNPIYPSDAVKAKIEGQVTLEVLISEDGTVREVSALTGPEELRSAAADAVKWWRFEPYEVQGRPAPVRTLIAVDFRLSGSAN